MTEHADLTRWASSLGQQTESDPTATTSALVASGGTLMMPYMPATPLSSWIVGYDLLFPNPKADEPEHLERSDPFVGWKTLQIVVTKKGKVKLRGGWNTQYGPDATAECTRDPLHVAPVWSCSCGFYALKELPKSPEHGWFRARVELFGTVVAAAHGWRASRQRVLSMETFRGCKSRDCGKRAEGFQVGRNGIVWPVCAKHAPLGWATLSELAGKLGTEVGWVDV